MSTLLRLAGLGCLALLGGCQSIFGHHALAQVRMRGEERLDPHAFAAAQLAAGRDALAQEQYGLALIAFRNAESDPEFAAAAHNGLAIAFSGVGRLDLTERYFKLAVAEAPADQRYQANLSHFYDQTRVAQIPAAAEVSPLAEAIRATSSQPVSAGAAVRVANNGAVVRIEFPAARMQRVSASEVHIASLPPPAPRKIGRPVPAVAQADGYPVRISLQRR